MGVCVHVTDMVEALCTTWKVHAMYSIPLGVRPCKTHVYARTYTHTVVKLFDMLS